MGYSPWGGKESGTTEHTDLHTPSGVRTSYIGQCQKKSPHSYSAFTLKTPFENMHF